MKISEHIQKDNLHHAYLIEGARNVIVPEILSLCESMNISISGNPDFCQITIDNFKIDEAFDLRAMSSNKSLVSSKKIFVICANSFSLDAQNVLLKMFEEPTPDTHFFLIVPDTNALLKTLISRFYLISSSSTRQDLVEFKDIEKFLAMSPKNRIDFIKELLAESEEEDEEGNEIIALDSTRSKAIKFLNELEVVLYKKMSKAVFDIGMFRHFFKVREFLRMPGSSIKNLMESVAFSVPEKI